jgi:hypothetical protein
VHIVVEKTLALARVVVLVLAPLYRIVSIECHAAQGTITITTGVIVTAIFMNGILAMYMLPK